MLWFAVGNCIVKVPDDDDLLEPKSKTATALLLCEELYINAPLAVIVAVVKLKSAKSVKPTVPELSGVTFVKVPPPVEYDPLVATSPVVTNTVVVAPRVAVVLDLPPLLIAYKANLKVFPLELVKLCVAVISSFLKLVHIA